MMCVVFPPPPTISSSLIFLLPLYFEKLKALKALIKTSDGDLRRAITYLQSASRLHAATKTPLTAISVQEIGGVVPDGVMNELGKALGVEMDEDIEMDGNGGGSGGAGKSKSAFENVQRAVLKVCREGYSATQVLSQVCLFSFLFSFLFL